MYLETPELSLVSQCKEQENRHTQLLVVGLVQIIVRRLMFYIMNTRNTDRWNLMVIFSETIVFCLFLK